MGKSRLVAEFAGRVGRRGARSLLGGCVELGDIGVPYLPMVEALRGLAEDPTEAELLAEIAASAPGVRQLLPGVVGPAPLGRPVDQDDLDVAGLAMAPDDPAAGSDDRLGDDAAPFRTVWGCTATGGLAPRSRGPPAAWAT